MLIPPSHHLLPSPAKTQLMEVPDKVQSELREVYFNIIIYDTASMIYDIIIIILVEARVDTVCEETVEIWPCRCDSLMAAAVMQDEHFAR